MDYGAVLFQLDGRRGPPFARGHALQEFQREHLRDVLETFLHNRHEILVVDVLLAVRELAEQLVGALEFGLRQLVAHLFIAFGKGMPAGVFSQHNLVRGQAHRLRRDDLVGDGVLQHAILVDAGLVGKGVGAYYGLVRLHGHAGQP